MSQYVIGTAGGGTRTNLDNPQSSPSSGGQGSSRKDNPQAYSKWVASGKSKPSHVTNEVPASPQQFAKAKENADYVNQAYRERAASGMKPIAASQKVQAAQTISMDSGAGIVQTTTPITVVKSSGEKIEYSQNDIQRYWADTMIRPTSPLASGSTAEGQKVPSQESYGTILKQGGNNNEQLRTGEINSSNNISNNNISNRNVSGMESNKEQTPKTISEFGIFKNQPQSQAPAYSYKQSGLVNGQAGEITTNVFKKTTVEQPTDAGFVAGFKSYGADLAKGGSELLTRIPVVGTAIKGIKEVPASIVTNDKQRLENINKETKTMLSPSTVGNQFARSYTPEEIMVTKTAIVFGAGVATGGVTSALSATTLGGVSLATPVTVAGLGLTSLYAGTKTYQIVTAPTNYERGRISAETAVEVASFGLGAKVGSEIFPKGTNINVDSNVFKSKISSNEINTGSINNVPQGRKPFLDITVKSSQPTELGVYTKTSKSFEYGIAEKQGIKIPTSEGGFKVVGSKPYRPIFRTTIEGYQKVPSENIFEGYSSNIKFGKPSGDIFDMANPNNLPSTIQQESNSFMLGETKQLPPAIPKLMESKIESPSLKFEGGKINIIDKYGKIIGEITKTNTGMSKGQSGVNEYVDKNGQILLQKMEAPKTEQTQEIKLESLKQETKSQEMEKLLREQKSEQRTMKKSKQLTEQVLEQPKQQERLSVIKEMEKATKESTKTRFSALQERMTGMKQKSKTVTEQLSMFKLSNEQIPKTEQIQKSEQILGLSYVSKQIPEQIPKQMQFQQQDFMRGTQVTEQLKIPPISPVGGFGFPEGGASQESRGEKATSKFGFGYDPSLSALYFGYKGGKETLGGIGIRPILTGRMKA